MPAPTRQLHSEHPEGKVWRKLSPGPALSPEKRDLDDAKRARATTAVVLRALEDHDTLARECTVTQLRRDSVRL